MPFFSLKQGNNFNLRFSSILAFMYFNTLYNSLWYPLDLQKKNWIKNKKNYDNQVVISKM
jgi:hypothetical protein